LAQESGSQAKPVPNGKSADVYACVNLTVKPTTKLKFDFTPVSTNCMNHKGNNVTIEADKAGVSCGSVGYVEAKGSGSCAFESSRWNLSYAGNGNPYSGSVHTKWATGMGIKFESYSPKSSVNTSAAVSTATQMNWDGNGPIYIIFTPGAQSAKK
jgi:hypothetical protein